eukprot:2843687-Prorocentrum_lima.AAC.1
MMRFPGHGKKCKEVDTESRKAWLPHFFRPLILPLSQTKRPRQWQRQVKKGRGAALNSITN